MPSVQDPFYVVRDEIQDSIDKFLSKFHQWEHIASDTTEKVHLTKELLISCESIEWQVDELDKAISVAARDPAWYGIDEVELEKRRRWTSTARTQVGKVKKELVVVNDSNKRGTTGMSGTRRELMRLTNFNQTDRPSLYKTQDDDDDFIASESDRQMLLVRQQDEELGELSESVVVLHDLGLTIHEELIQQDTIFDDFSIEMDRTSNRLDFVRKKVGMMMKKAGAKGQVMMILFLLLLLIILFVLVFLT